MAMPPESTVLEQAAAAAAPFMVDPADAAAIAQGRHGDPFAVLGPHPGPGGCTVLRAFLPGARAVSALKADGQLLAVLAPTATPGLFAGRIDNSGAQADASAYARRHAPGAPSRPHYRLRIDWAGSVQETEDPYAFGSLLGELDLHLIGEGRHHELGRVLGAQLLTVDGVSGVRFAVWAPNARRVSVVGHFNGWDGRRHAMRLRHGAGVWELFIPQLGPGEVYKYEILGPEGLLPLKADPVALAAEAPPATGSVVAQNTPFAWNDEDWMRRRSEAHAPDAPMSVYEVHAASWRRADGGRPLGWDELAAQLIPYALDLGFTHIELLPIMEHPFGGSWGYQPLSQFAPTARHGAPEQFARFVDACHDAGLGVILDWVPAHFPTDEHGLAFFDGTALYEHADPREGFHPDWNTAIYNLGRHEVQGFLIGSALHWLEHFHVDGLRVDAVASMLYRDYSRKPGEWVPNAHGGRENLEAVHFLQQLNAVVSERVPGAMMIAEESTAWPGVTRPVHTGGLGFSYKWNMGWMHDSLQYIERDPMHRRWHHDELSFSMVYAYSERYMLPLSHDEVVHGKGALIGKMPGDDWQRFANLRAYFGFMWAHPGKKLLFMGCEFAQGREWNHDRELDWRLLAEPRHAGVQQLLRDLNRLLRAEPALHALDSEPGGFQWLVGDDSRNSVYAFLRLAPQGAPLLVVCNLTPVPRHGYRVGVPGAGLWREALNTDAEAYGGSNLGNGGAVSTQAEPAHGQPHSLALLLPPLSTLILRHDARIR
jgi:1,4-alpha-glucan branching enzyme